MPISSKAAPFSATMPIPSSRARESISDQQLRDASLPEQCLCLLLSQESLPVLRTCPLQYFRQERRYPLQSCNRLSDAPLELAPLRRLRSRAGQFSRKEFGRFA